MGSGFISLPGGGSVSTFSPVTQTSTGNFSNAADLVICDASGGAWTGTLPASGTATKAITLLKKDSTFNAISISASGADQIVDTSTGSSNSLNSPGESVYLVPDGASKWYVVKRDYPRSLQSFTLTASGLPNAVTTNPTLGTGTLDANNHALWCRRNDGIEVNLYVGVTAAGTATSGSGNYLFPLPNGLQAASKLNYASGWVKVGSAQAYNGTINAEGSAMLDTIGQNLMMRVIWTGNNGNFVGSAAFQIGPAYYQIQAFIPIQGWN